MLIPAALNYPRIDPFIFHMGPVGLSWYATMYVIGFVIAYFVLRYRYRQGALKFQNADQVSLLLTYCFYGLILGARIFYVLFYNLKFYLEHPLEIPAVWHGGMSFHGGLIGCTVAIYLFARRYKIAFFNITDSIVLAAPFGLFFGRLGNFINGELYGRVSDVPWAMVFPGAGPLPRHPSQLYEALLEGLVLAAFLWFLAKKRVREGVVSVMLLIGYGAMRFIVEFFREPDAQLGTVLGPFSMGQLLCFSMIFSGLVLLKFLPSSRAQ